MKFLKFLPVLLIAVFAMGGATAGTCETALYTFSRTANVPYDEYLFPYGSNIEIAGETHKGVAYRCGNDGVENPAECDKDTFIYLTEGHKYGSNERQQETVYKCEHIQEGGREQDYWEPYKIMDDCPAEYYDKLKSVDVKNELNGYETFYEVWNDYRVIMCRNKVKCDEKTLNEVKKISDEYQNLTDEKSKTINTQAKSIIDYCTAESIDKAEFAVKVGYLNSLLRGIGRTSISVDITSRQRLKIQQLHSQINTTLSGLDDVTVWRNLDGTFNTSRLVSDSVAGVVLGTAGGLITSNVIKKNQIKNGFEDLSCTIGGQVVAGWDDEFVVNPPR